MRPARYERGLRRVVSVASATILTFVHLLYATIRQNSVLAELHFRLEDDSDGCGVHRDGPTFSGFRPCSCGLSDYLVVPSYFRVLRLSSNMGFLFGLQSRRRCGPPKISMRMLRLG